MIDQALISLVFSLAPPLGPENDADAYAHAANDLREATTLVNTDPEIGIPELDDSLNSVRRFPLLLAADPPTQDLLFYAELALARAELRRGKPDAAVDALDRALAELELVGKLDDIDLETIGPSLRKLFEERKRALAAAPRARLRVACSEPPDSVIVDQRKVDIDMITGPGLLLTLGSHEVWIHVDGAEPAPRTIPLDAERAVTTIPCPVVESQPVPDIPDIPAPQPPTKRLAPRWVEGGLVAAGLSLATVGGVLWGIDGRCRGGGSTDSCPKVFDTQIAGIATLAGGAALLITGAALLGADQARIRRRVNAKVRVGAGIIQF
ncbi:hypothetical protein ACNOYE_25850 [Nannocystaceae bacterium ST9]